MNIAVPVNKRSLLMKVEIMRKIKAILRLKPKYFLYPPPEPTHLAQRLKFRGIEFFAFSEPTPDA